MKALLLSKIKFAECGLVLVRYFLNYFPNIVHDGKGFPYLIKFSSFKIEFHCPDKMIHF